MSWSFNIKFLQFIRKIWKVVIKAKWKFHCVFHIFFSSFLYDLVLISLAVLRSSYNGRDKHIYSNKMVEWPVFIVARSLRVINVSEWDLTVEKWNMCLVNVKLTATVIEI